MQIRRPGTSSEPLQEFDSIEQLVGNEYLDEGRFSVTYESTPIDFMFREADSDTVVVTFHGAALNSISLPWHPGNGVMEGVPAKWLAISDPSLLLDESLTLSWFAGSSHQPELQSVIARIVKVVVQKSSAKHLVFFGTSGGGFAALEMSRRFAGSLAIPLNPQTSIGAYYERLVQKYLVAAWSVETLDDLGSAQICHDLIGAYDSTHSNTIAYVQNSRDIFHICRHQRPFFRKIGNSSNLWLRTSAWGDPKKTGHVVPPKLIINQILVNAAYSDGDWESALESSDFSPVA